MEELHPRKLRAPNDPIPYLSLFFPNKEEEKKEGGKISRGNSVFIAEEFQSLPAVARGVCLLPSCCCEATKGTERVFVVAVTRIGSNGGGVLKGDPDVEGPGAE